MNEEDVRQITVRLEILEEMQWRYAHGCVFITTICTALLMIVIIASVASIDACNTAPIERIEQRD